MTRTRKDIEDEEKVEEVKVKKVRRVVEDDDDEDYEEMTTEERIVNIEKRVNHVFILAWICVFTTTVSMILLLVNGTGGLTKNNSTTTNSGTESESYSYDTSMFKEISATDIATESKNTTIVVMIGRQSCGYCAQFAPILASVGSEYGVTVRYIDFEKIVDINTKTIKDQDSITAINNLKGDGTWENFAAEYFGSTPQTMFIKNGRVIYGIAGYREAADTRTAFEAAGFKKSK